MDTIIATVPDPESTGLRLSFDRVIESIERSAGASNNQLTFRRHWFPWDPTTHRESDDPHKRARAEAEHRNRLKKPGVLLFDKGNAEKLVIYLVGESPISGINVSQLSSAESDIKTRNGKLLGFLGPNFSGSWGGLKTFADRHSAFADRHSKVLFYSVATSRTSQHKIAQQITKKNKWCDAPITVTVHTAQSQLQAFISYIVTNWDVDKNKALSLISEDETAFAHDVSTRDLEKDKCDLSYSGSEVDYIPRLSTIFRFPREISHLRNAAPDIGVGLSPQSKNFQIFNQLLPFSVRESNTHSADIPNFSEQTPLSQESILLQIAIGLNRQKAQFGALLATNPLDITFLARFLHNVSPNTRLLGIDPDLLLTHGTDSAEFQGMLLTSTYPLFSQNQIWTRDKSPNIDIFASPESEGVYNALSVLLGGNDELLDYTSPFESGPAPPLWLTVVGRNGFWPIDLLPVPSHGNPFLQLMLRPRFDPRSKPVLAVNSPLRSWWACFTIVSVMCIIVILIHFLVGPTGSRHLTVFSLKPKESGLADRAFWLCNLMLSLGLLSGLWTVIPFRLMQLDRWPIASNWAVAASVFGSVVTIGIFVVAARCGIKVGNKPLLPDSQHRTFYTRFLLCEACAILSLAYIGIHFAFSSDKTTFFLAYRAIYLTNGVSPLVPASLIFAGIASYSFINLERVTFYSDRRASVPRLLGDRICPKIHELVIELSEKIHFPKFNWYDRAALGTITVSGVIYLRFHPHQSVEPSLYEYVFIALVLALVLLISGTYIQLRSIWSLFQEVLRELERHPLRKAFGRLPIDFVWSPTWQGGSKQRTHVMITRSIECIEAIISSRKTPSWLYHTLKRNLADIRAEAGAVLDHARQRRRISSTVYQSVQAQLAAMGEILAVDLRRRWDVGSYEIRSDEGKNQNSSVTVNNDESEPFVIEEQFVSFRYLAFINYVLIQLQNLMGILSILFLLLVLALNSYPFLSRSIITGALTIIFILNAALVGRILASLDRDAILSRATGTTEGKLDKFFFFKLVSYGALPLLAILGSQFPGFGRFLFSWLAPAMESLH